MLRLAGRSPQGPLSLTPYPATPQRRPGLRAVAAVALAAVLAVLAYAWIDGGREDLQEIAVEIPVPGAAQ